ncbi:MAG: sulfotransferase [Acidimicrobiia bacterium]|nr:sulfotransferase [Acidimicrobiia bacterium]
MHDFWALPLVVRAAPDAKLLVMLRDPFDRYVSGLARALAMDKFGRKTTLAQDSLSRCYYHSQLRALLDLVPREQVKILQFERCVADPAGQYCSTLEFLGYDDTTYLPDDLAEPLNSTRNAKPAVPDHVRARAIDLLEGDVRSLAAAFPDEVDVSLWRNFSHLAG